MDILVRASQVLASVFAALEAVGFVILFLWLIAGDLRQGYSFILKHWRLVLPALAIVLVAYLVVRAVR